MKTKHIIPESRLEENLINIVYLSKELISFETSSIDLLVEKAATFNASVHICGFLYYFDHYFVQYLEGQRSHVEALMNRIKEDKRHEVLVDLNNEKAMSRKFKAWNMHNLNKSQSTIRAGHILFQRMELLLGKDVSNDPGNQEKIWSFINTFSNTL